jgi:hypothetical protein
MAVAVEWVLAGRVALIRLEGAIGESDLVQASTALLSGYLEGAGVQQVHLVVHTLGITEYPRNVVDFFPRIPDDPLDRVGYVIVITTQPILRFVAAVYVKLSRRRFRAVSTLADALTCLCEVDASLPPDLGAHLLQ